MNDFSLLFLVLLSLALATEIWLARRQINHVLTRRGKVPATFKGKISLKEHKKAADYTVAKSRFGIAEDILAALLLLLWTLGGGIDLLDRLWRSLEWNPLFTGTAFMVSAFFIMGLLSLPASVYQTFVLEERFGFNRTTPLTFFSDLVKTTLLLLLFGLPLAMAVLWLMQEMGELWWGYVWLLWTGFSLFMIWAYPTLIAPLFNKFRRLRQGNVRKRIQSLLSRTGFKSNGIFVMDGSRRSAHGNAYFTGFGKNKRIIFFDTLLKSLSESEIEAVLAHELGHFKLRHILKRMALTFALSLAALALLGWLMQQDWFYSGLGMTQPSTHAALMLFILIGPVFTFFLQPLMARSSRKHEFEADRFAADVTNSRYLVSALVKLYKENASTLTPDPLHSVFYDSHPPAPIRIAQLQGKS
jgi:STE24 endopeptidase